MKFQIRSTPTIKASSNRIMAIDKHRWKSWPRDLPSDLYKESGAFLAQKENSQRGGKLVFGILFRQAGFYAIANGVSRAVPLLLIPLCATYIGKKGYGILGLAIMFQTFLISFLTYTISNTVINIYHEVNDLRQRKAILGTLWIFVLSFAIICCGSVEFFGEWLFETLFEGFPYLPYGRYVICTSFISITFTLIPLAILRASQNARAYTAVMSLNAIIQLFFILYFLILKDEGVTGVLKGLLAAALMMSMPYSIILLRNIAFRFSLRPARKYIAFGLPLIFELIALWVLGFSDRFILNKAVSLEELGTYTLGYQIGMVVNLVVNSIDTAWYPYFAALERTDCINKSAIKRIVTFIVLLISISGMCIALLAESALLIIGAEFSDASKITPWIAASYVFLGFAIIPRTVLLTDGRTIRLAVAACTAAITSLLLNLMIVPRYGIQSAAVVNLVSYLVLMLLTLYAAGEKWLFLYDFKDLSLIPVFGGFAILIGLRINVPSPLLMAGLRVLFIVIILFTGLLVVRFFHRK